MVQMRFAWGVLFAAGCLTPNVVPCGNDICPQGSVCIDGQICGTANSIAACTGLADAAPCHAQLGDGYCSHGSCTPNVCGDGQITGIEQCDGSLVSISCADLGYYAGATTCSPLCTIDRSGCAGKCGDGVVQAAQGEDCDGAPPDNLTCPDLGYDYGALACSATCTADPIHSCERFGWHALGMIGYPATVVGDAGIYAILTNGAVELHDGATTTTHAGGFNAIDARHGKVVAATATGVDLWQSSAWTSLAAPPLPTGTAIIEVTLDEDDDPFVLATDSAGNGFVGSYLASAWTFVAVPANASQLTALHAGNFAVVLPGGNIAWQWPGCSTTAGNSCQCLRPYPGAPATATVALIVDSGYLSIYSWDVGSQHAVLGIVPQCGGGPGQTVLGTLPGVNVKPLIRGAQMYFTDLAAFGTTWYRLAGSRLESFAGPQTLTGAPPDGWITRDGVVFAQSDLVLERLGDYTLTKRGPAADQTPQNYAQMSLASDGTLVTCGVHVWANSGLGFLPVGNTGVGGPQCMALFAQTATAIYADMCTTGPCSISLNLWNGSTWVPQTLGGTIGVVTALAGNANIVVGVRAAGDLIEKQSGIWAAMPALPASCIASSLAVAADDTIYVGGSCTAPASEVIWRYDSTGMAWTELDRDTAGSAFTSLAITTDGTIYAASTNKRVVIGAGTTWTAYPGMGAVVAAVSATDAFASEASAGNHVRHWDGTRWTPINVDPANDYFAVAATTSDLILFGEKYPSPTPELVTFVRSP